MAPLLFSSQMPLCAPLLEARTVQATLSPEVKFAAKELEILRSFITWASTAVTSSVPVNSVVQVYETFPLLQELMLSIISSFVRISPTKKAMVAPIQSKDQAPPCMLEAEKGYPSSSITLLQSMVFPSMTMPWEVAENSRVLEIVGTSSPGLQEILK